MINNIVLVKNGLLNYFGWILNRLFRIKLIFLKFWLNSFLKIKIEINLGMVYGKMSSKW